MMSAPGVALAQDADPQLVGELLGFRGSEAIVTVMTTHCYETTGLDTAYQDAAQNWYLRNVGFLDMADRVIERLGGAAPEQATAAATYGGEQIMTAYNQAADKDAFCQGFLAQVEGGALDIDKQLPQVLAKAQDIATE